MKYTQAELTELIKDVFAQDKTTPSFHADDEGTFKNSEQYAAMDEATKALFPFEFKNPNVKAAEAIDSKELEELKAKNADQETQIVDLKAEIERLSGLKSVAAVKAAEAETEKLKLEVDELKKKVLELQPQ